MAEGGISKWKAFVIGGTGATGRHLVGYLLKHKDKVDKVTVLGRRKLEVSVITTIPYSTFPCSSVKIYVRFVPK